MFGMLAAAFIIGIAVAIPPGAVMIAGSQRAITRGFGDAFNFFIGVVAADAFYAVLVYFGLSTLFKDSVAFKLILWILGGAWLCWLGIAAIRTRVEFSAAVGPMRPQTIQQSNVLARDRAQLFQQPGNDPFVRRSAGNVREHDANAVVGFD